MIGTLLALTGLVDADPCGMVPPIYLGSGPPPTIERVGAQRTYVMHRQIPGVGGVETMALRPGFTGNVEDFGMLIPFPSPPAIRKIEDDTFAHLENAVDPPEMTVELYEPYPVSRSRSGHRLRESGQQHRELTLYLCRQRDPRHGWAGDATLSLKRTAPRVAVHHVGRSVAVE